MKFLLALDQHEYPGSSIKLPVMEDSECVRVISQPRTGYVISFRYVSRDWFILEARCFSPRCFCLQFPVVCPSYGPTDMRAPGSCPGIALRRSPGANCRRAPLCKFSTTRGRSHRWSSSSTRSPSASERVIFSGIQPTGVPHLGNYLGALREWVKLQREAGPDTKLFFSVVDLHALTVPQDAAQLKRWRAETFATLLAVGLDPKRSAIFFQSAVCSSSSDGILVAARGWLH